VRRSSGPQTYVSSGPTHVVLVEWQSASTGIDGTFTVDTVAGTAPAESVSVQSVPFTGAITGSSMTLTFDEDFLGGTKTLYATLGGSTLTINVLSSGGAIQSGTLHSSNTQAYNAAVAALHKSISQTNARVTAEEQAQARQQADAQAEQ
jgi:outer membrane murein-binding lipoprotein Lpp